MRNRYLNKNRRYLAIGVGIILIILLGISNRLYQWSSNKTTPISEKLPIQTVLAKTVSLPITLETVGSLIPMKEVKLKAAGLGRVEKMWVESGSWVKKGTLLLNILGFAAVRAPFDGYLTDWKVKVGEFVSTGTELIDVIDAQTLSLQYRFPEEYAPKLDIGQKVTLSVRAFPGRVFTGHVTFISPMIDKKTHTLTVHAQMQNEDQSLWPGMSAHVAHTVQIEPNAVVVPESSLNLGLEGYELWVVEGDKLVRRSVQVGVRYQGRAQIISGVGPKEAVLLTQTDDITEGVVVIPHHWTGDW